MQVKPLSYKVGGGQAHWLCIFLLAPRGTKREGSSSLGYTAWKPQPERMKAVNIWLLMLNSTQQPCFYPERHFAFPRSRLQRWLVSPDNLRSSTKKICFRWKEGFCLMTSRPKWEAWFPHWQQGRCLPRSTLAPGIASSRASGWMCIGSQERAWGWLEVSEMSCSNVHAAPCK